MASPTWSPVRATTSADPVAHVGVAARNDSGVIVWLSVRGRDVRLASGVLDEPSLLVLETAPSGDFALRTADDGAVVTFGRDGAGRVTAEPPASPSDPRQYFRKIPKPDAPGWYNFVIDDGGAPKLVGVADDGCSLVLDGARPCDFTIVFDPVIGAVTLSAALRYMDNKRLALWHREGGAWVTLHPRGPFLEPDKFKVREGAPLTARCATTQRNTNARPLSAARRFSTPHPAAAGHCAHWRVQRVGALHSACH